MSSYACARSCTQLHAHAFKRAQILLARFFQSGLNITNDITNPEDRQTTGLEKGVLTGTARVGGQWQMRGVPPAPASIPVFHFFFVACYIT